MRLVLAAWACASAARWNVTPCAGGRRHPCRAPDGSGLQGRRMCMGVITWYNDEPERDAMERSVMTTHPTTAPHYLELLNMIASGERRAGVYLQAWADTTPDPELRACLSMIADRETSHYHIFKRRIAELGYTWTETQDPDFTERLTMSDSDRSDVE